ncbi:MAG: GFA family protein [Roseobacter sp.]
MKQTGGCLCGAVTYTLNEPAKTTGACHCAMCRKWSGGVYLGVQVPDGGLQVRGGDNLQTYASSPWAERAFCRTCGSSLWYRITAEGPHQGEHHVGLGTFDDATGIALTEEIFIDKKPDGYGFAQNTKVMTEAEVMALFAAG